MAKYRITAPDGASFEITAPDDATPDQVQAYAQQQFAAMKPAPAGRAADGGVMGGIKQGLRDPIDAGAQMLRRIVPEPVAKAVDAAGNWLADQGLPVARSEGVQGVDQIVRQSGQQYEADRAAAGRSGFDAARLTGNVVNPVNLALPSAAGARTVGQLAKVGALAGGIGGALQPVTDGGDFWTDKAKQAAAGAAGGAVLTPVLSKAAQGAGNAVKRAMTGRPQEVTVIGGRPGLTREDLDAAVGQLLQSQGMTAQEAPEVILNSVRRQITEALAGGERLNPAQTMRRAQAEALGLTGDAGLTRGQLTRDPMQFAQERNLSGVVINTPAGPSNPLASRFSRQNQVLASLFDDAGGAADRVTGGEILIGAANEGNRRADDAVRAAYQAFEQATGKKLDIPLQGLAQDYAETLRRYGDNIPGPVRAALERLGLMDGRQRSVFTIEAAEDLIKNVINKNDPGPINRPVHGALGELRAAIENAIASGADNASGGAGAEAAMLAKEARSTAAGVYQTRRDIPALQAALKDVAPDRFVQQFLFNAPAREVDGLAQILSQSPEAQQQARAQVLRFLQRAAFGENLAGDKTFAPERYARALEALGPQKLRVFFSPDEAVRLTLAGRVAAEINSVPAGATHAVNHSGTAAGMFNLLQRLAESPMVRNIPGARALSDQAGQIVQERAIQGALQPVSAATKPAPQLSPEAVRALQALFAPAAAAGGAALGSGY